MLESLLLPVAAFLFRQICPVRWSFRAELCYNVQLPLEPMLFSTELQYRLDVFLPA